MFADAFSLLSLSTLSQSWFVPEEEGKYRFILVSVLLLHLYKLEENQESEVKY